MIALSKTTALDELTDEQSVADHFASIVAFFGDSTDEQLAEICRVSMTPVGFALSCGQREEFIKACIRHTIACVLADRQSS